SALPAEVVARQSAAVDIVSGATLSARAFEQAVAQAIAQAAQPS
ncbi:MAG: FMN-binding protein, partial [Chloroflexi bacterium]|nr:FMN-binding protein [Chloroflexota bacterium]